MTVVNLVLCDESDELIAGAIDLHYSTQPHLNIKQMLVHPYLSILSTVIIFNGPKSSLNGFMPDSQPYNLEEFIACLTNFEGSPTRYFTLINTG